MQQVRASIISNDVETLKSLVGPLPSRLDNGLTSLQFAALNNAFDVLPLFAHEARLLTKEGKTALMLAARKGHTESVAYLAPLESKLLCKNISALEYAANNGHFEAVKILVGHEEERAKIAMFRARAAKEIEICNFLKEYISNNKNCWTETIDNLSEITASIKTTDRVEQPESSQHDKIMSGVFSDTEPLKVEQLVSSPKSEKVEETQVQKTLVADYDDPSNVIESKVDSLSKELQDCKGDYEKALSACESFRDITIDEQSEILQLEKQLSCLKVDKRSMQKKYEEQQKEIEYHAIGNEELKEELSECEKQLLYKENQLQYINEQHFIKSEEARDELDKAQDEIAELRSERELDIEKLSEEAELLDMEIQQADAAKKELEFEKKTADDNQEIINELQGELAEQREVLGQAAEQNDLAEQEIKELKKLIENEDLEEIFEKLQDKAEKIFVPTILKLKEKMGV